MSLTEDSLMQYLADFHGVDTTGIDKSTLLFSTGLVDSFTVIDLISHIEAETGARFPAADITFDNLDSIERILAYLTRRAA